MFHDHHSENVVLSSDRKTAEGEGVLLSGKRLHPGEKFEVQIDETVRGETWTLALGVTTTDPGSHPQLPEWAKEVSGSWVVWGDTLYMDGKEAGSWKDKLWVEPKVWAGVTWTEDGSVYISHNDKTTLAFTGVPGPVWAVTQLDQSVQKMSVAPGASVSSIPRALHTTTVSCPYWELCDRFVGSLSLPAVFFGPQDDACFCGPCIATKGHDLYYSRGQPPKWFGIPTGWARFGLSVPARIQGNDTYNFGHIAYHGTIPQKLRSIIESQDILMPDGKELVPHTEQFPVASKLEDTGTRHVFVSPTITYAGHTAYARPHSWMDTGRGQPREHTMQVALQLRIKLDSYQVGPETLGLQEIIDAKFKNTELEWSTKIRGATIPVGILVKVDIF